MDLFFVLITLILIYGLGNAIAGSNLLHALAYGVGLIVVLVAYLYARKRESVGHGS